MLEALSCHIPGATELGRWGQWGKGWLLGNPHLFLSTPLLRRAKEERGKVRKQLQQH